MSKTLRKRVLSGVTSAVMAMSYVLGTPGWLPLNPLHAGADDGLVYPIRAIDVDTLIESSTVENEQGGRDPAVLLAGKNAYGPKKECLLVPYDVQATLDNYNAAYALGIASQFCIFVNDDLQVTESDAEGRVAAGGNVSIATPWSSYSFAKGDFAHQIPLSDLIDDHGYAHLIIGGELVDGVVNDGYYDTNYNFQNEFSGADSGDLRAWSFAKKDKILVLNRDELGNISLLNIPDAEEPGKPQRSIDQTQTYITKLFDFNEQFAMLKERSRLIDLNAKESRLQDDAVTVNGGEVIFDAGLRGEVQDVVTFNISKEKWEAIANGTTFRFEGIPSLSVPRDVVHADDTTYEVTTEKWPYAFIVINVEGEGEFTVAYDNVATFINGEEISNRGSVASNNHPGVTSLLYNYSGATDLGLAKNFSGTVLAPNADVHDGPNGRGHLSGALLAKSFHGATEFGYRPYSGPTNILGLNLKYVVRATKTDQTGDEPVEGATFTLFRLDDDPDNPGEKIEVPVVRDLSDADGNVTLPFIGAGEYVLRETKAAPGYLLGDTKYHFTVERDEANKSLVKFSNGTATVPGSVIIMNADDVAEREGKDVDDLTFEYIADQNYEVQGNPEADSTYGKTIGPNNADVNVGPYNPVTGTNDMQIHSVTLWLTDPYSITKQINARMSTHTFEAVQDGSGYKPSQNGDPANTLANNSSHILEITADVTAEDDAEGRIEAHRSWEMNVDLGLSCDVAGSGTYTLYSSTDTPYSNYELWNYNFYPSNDNIKINSFTFKLDNDAFVYQETQTLNYSKLTFPLAENGQFADFDDTAVISKNETNDIWSKVYKITADVELDQDRTGTLTWSALQKQIVRTDPEYVLFDNSVAPSPKDYTYKYKVQDSERGTPGIYTDVNDIYLAEAPHNVAVFSDTITSYPITVTYQDEPTGTKVFNPLDSDSNIYQINGKKYQFECEVVEEDGAKIARITKILENGVDVTAREQDNFRAKLILDDTTAEPILTDGEYSFWITDNRDTPYEPLADITPESGYSFRDDKALRLLKVDSGDDDEPLARGERIQLPE